MQSDGEVDKRNKSFKWNESNRKAKSLAFFVIKFSALNRADLD